MVAAGPGPDELCGWDRVLADDEFATLAAVRVAAPLGDAPAAAPRERDAFALRPFIVNSPRAPLMAAQAAGCSLVLLGSRKHGTIIGQRSGESATVWIQSMMTPIHGIVLDG